MSSLIRINCWALCAVAIVVCITINHGLQCASASLNQLDTCRFDTLRLPERIKPSHYELRLKFDNMTSVQIEGQVKINVTVGALSESCPPSRWSMKRMLAKKRRDKGEIPIGCNKREIILNANKLVQFKEIHFVVDRGLHKNRKPVPIDEICRDLDSELTSIKLKEKLEDNSHGQLIIDFQANINEEGREGLYRSFWRDRKTNEKQVSYVTQFEAANARKVFPCFDEPAFKATFDVVIDHDNEHTVLANTLPMERELKENNPNSTLVRTHFERTPVMSTYLLAFAVGRYDHLESKIMDEKMLMRVFTPVNETDRARYLLDTGRRAYAVLQDYFDIEQPLKKIDFLPINIGGGSAMENWGLVTLMDSMLLVDPNKITYELAIEPIIIAHELAHQWFGNLVTMKWWDNLWLNEAFAQWMGYLVANEIHPEFNVNILFVQDELMKGLESDADLQTTHPIKNPNLKTIHDIEVSFDDIVYNKGASVMRMIESYVGHESFKLALRDYLNKFKFQNTDETDLWATIEARSQVPVARMMHSWLNQAGFPIVAVTSLDNNKLHLKQAKFEKELTREGQKQLWMIPINMLVVHDDQSELVKFVLSQREQEITLPDWFDASKGHWFKLNADAVGFFRVHYDSKALALMEKPIRAKQMSVIDRMNLVDDMRALHSIKKADYLGVQAFLDWFEHEDSPPVVYVLTGMVGLLRKVSQGQSQRHRMLVDYFEKCNTEPVVGVQEERTKKEVLLELIKSNYEPAVAEGLKRYDEADSKASLWYPELAAAARAGDSQQTARLRGLLKDMSENWRTRFIEVIFEGVDQQRTNEVLENLLTGLE